MKTIDTVMYFLLFVAGVAGFAAFMEIAKGEEGGGDSGGNEGGGDSGGNEGGEVNENGDKMKFADDDVPGGKDCNTKMNEIATIPINQVFVCTAPCFGGPGSKKDMQLFSTDGETIRWIAHPYASSVIREGFKKNGGSSDILEFNCKGHPSISMICGSDKDAICNPK